VFDSDEDEEAVEDEPEGQDMMGSKTSKVLASVRKSCETFFDDLKEGTLTRNYWPDRDSFSN
jgi:hypothetical protein